MVYCNICDNFSIDEEDYFCCRFNDKLIISFNMDDLYKKCPKD